MRCDEQRILLIEEQCAWDAYKVLQDSGTQDKQEITRRAEDAAFVGLRLWEHISNCRICQTPTINKDRAVSNSGHKEGFSIPRSQGLYATLGT
jgi:hypothetical protein